MQRIVIPLLLAALASACMMSRETKNTPIPTDALAQLKPGETTADEVLELLGGPVEVVQLARRSAYRYQYDQAKRAGLVLIVVNFLNVDLRQDRLWVFFDENDVLTHVGTTYEGADTEWAMPWENVYD